MSHICLLTLNVKGIDCFVTLPNHRELEKYVLSLVQWQVLEDFEGILWVHPIINVYNCKMQAERSIQQVPLKVQQWMSGETQSWLGSAVPSFELFMTAWEFWGESNPHVKPWTDISIKWVTKYYQHMDNTQAYVVAMYTWHFLLLFIDSN